MLLVFTDIITRDGVLHVPARVLIPPHPKKSKVEEPLRVLDEEYTGEVDEEEEGGMTVEELRARLEPYL